MNLTNIHSHTTFGAKIQVAKADVHKIPPNLTEGLETFNPSDDPRFYFLSNDLGTCQLLTTFLVQKGINFQHQGGDLSTEDIAKIKHFYE